jgi:hypothetical protein
MPQFIARAANLPTFHSRLDSIEILGYTGLVQTAGGDDVEYSKRILRKTKGLPYKREAQDAS